MPALSSTYLLYTAKTLSTQPPLLRDEAWSFPRRRRTVIDREINTTPPMDEVPPPPGHYPAIQKPPGYKDPSSAAPQKPALRPLPSFYPPSAHKYRRRSCCNCTRCFCWTLLVLLIILLSIIVAGVIFYIYFQPRFPSFHLQSLNVSKFHISVHSDSAFLDSTVAASVQVKNHNRKIKYSFRKGNVTFYAVDKEGDVVMGLSSFPRFQQGTMKTITMKVTSRVKRTPVNGTVGNRLRSMFHDKNLKFLVVILTTLEAHLNNRLIVTFPAKIICGNVDLKKHINPGSLPPCTIVLPRWFKLWY